MMKALDPTVVNSFLKKLGIPDWKIRFESNKLSLLKDVVRKYIGHSDYAFQNLTLASTPPNQRKPPTPESSFEQCLTSLRGMCIDHNYFIAVLLKSVGYDTFLVGSTVSLLPIPLNHPLCIARLDSGLWLVDFGMGSVFPEPVPLHQLPFSFVAGGWTCEYRKEGNIFQRVHIRGDPMKGQFKDSEEEVRYQFTLEPMEYESFNEAMTIIYTDAHISFFLNNLYAFRYLSFNSAYDFEAVIFIGTTFITFTQTESLRKVFETYEDMEPTFAKYFPALLLNEYRNATKYFRTSNERSTKSSLLEK